MSYFMCLCFKCKKISCSYNPKNTTKRDKSCQGCQVYQGCQEDMKYSEMEMERGEGEG